MRFDQRIALAVVVLAVLTGGHFMFVNYLEAAGSTTTVPLENKLDTLTNRIGEFEGRDVDLDKDLDYGTDHLYRNYINPRTQQRIAVWAVYSEVGEDRGHHPDVCMAVAGKVQDKSATKEIEVEKHKGRIQQYLFRDAKGAQIVFYWHYTMESRDISGRRITEMQNRYRRNHKRPSSMTVEVFAEVGDQAKLGEVEEAAQEFVKSLEKELTEDIVGPNAELGSQRIAVMVVDDAARQDKKTLQRED